MEVYRSDKNKIDKPSKFVAYPDGYEVVTNDGTIKIALVHTTVLEGSMDSDFYHTIMWILEDKKWTRVNNTQSYRTKEDFLKAISESEDFTEAMNEYRKKETNGR